MKTESGKLKGRVSHYGGADEMGPPTVEQYEAQHGGNSGKFTGSDIANIIDSAGNTLSSIINGIFQKPDTYNTYVTGGGSGEKSNTGLYIGIGAAVLVLILVVVIALKK